MRVLPDQFYCENDAPGLPAGYDVATLDWMTREQSAEPDYAGTALLAIAEERQALQDSGRHVAAVGGFSNSAVGVFEAVGGADAHGGRRINVLGEPAVCAVCGAPIRMIV